MRLSEAIQDDSKHECEAKQLACGAGERRREDRARRNDVQVGNCFEPYQEHVASGQERRNTFERTHRLEVDKHVPIDIDFARRDGVYAAFSGWILDDQHFANTNR